MVVAGKEREAGIRERGRVGWTRALPHRAPLCCKSLVTDRETGAGRGVEGMCSGSPSWCTSVSNPFSPTHSMQGRPLLVRPQGSQDPACPSCL